MGYAPIFKLAKVKIRRKNSFQYYEFFMTGTWSVTFRRLIGTSEKLVPIYQRK